MSPASRYALLAPIILLLLATCGQEESVRFVDVTESAGIGFRYTFGDTTYQNILESSGSGVSVFDFDGDGWMDLYVLNGTYLEGISEPHGEVWADTRNELYRNNGDGTFTEMAAFAGLDHPGWGMAAAPFDYDGDGDVDLYLVNYGPNVFYRNNGDGTFTDITDQLGLRGPDSLNGFVKWSAGAVFWDFDVDGRADLLVCNFLAFDPAYISPDAPDMMPHPNEYRGQASMLYRQEVDGTFRDVTREVGFWEPDSKCMGHTVFDFDEDGDLDLFQGNDHQPNYLFRNDGDRFVEVARMAGVAVNDLGLPTGSMHGSIGDVDGDGKIDLLVSDLEHGALYRHKGGGVFEDITRRAGIASQFDGKGQWAVILFDFDNDGDLDLFAANGTAEELILQLPFLMKNDGTGRFRDVGAQVAPDYFTRKRSGRAAVRFDFDNDGDLDLFVSHIDLDGRPALLRNDGGNRNRWFGLSLFGAGGPASAIGAVVTVEAGGKRQVSVNQWATSYLSHHDPRMHFGLGSAERIDRLAIRWPSGRIDVFEDVEPNRYVDLREGGPLTEAATRTGLR